MKNITYALRYLAKSIGNNITKVISLTLGLAVSLLVFSYVTFEASYDRFMPDKERIYQLWLNIDLDGLKDVSSMMMAPIAPTLKEEIPAIEAATRYKDWNASLFYDNEPYSARGVMVDTMFFDVLDYGVLRGDPRKIFADKNLAMISESFAKTVFGDKDPVGEVIKYNNERPFTVAGVFRDIPKNTQLGKFDALISFDLAPDFGFYTGWDGGDSFPTFVKLKKGARIEDAEALMGDFLDRHKLTEMFDKWNMTIFFAPLTKSRTTGNPTQNLALILMIVAFVTLFIAAMNYVLISISMLMKRGKTMAMLKCNGAARKDIFAISMWETVFVMLVSLILVVFIIFAADNTLKNLADISAVDLFAWERIWSPLLVILVAFALAAVIPARIFAAVPVSTAFKGGSYSKQWWKKALLFVQLVIVTLVITFLLVSIKQFNHIAKGDYGYNHKELIYTSFTGTPLQLETYKNELRAMPDIESVGAGYSLPIWGYSGQPAYDEVSGELLFSARTELIDYNYIPAMEMKILAGRNFAIDEGGDKGIINRMYAEMRGWTPEEAVGKHLSNQGAGGDIYTVIGVVEDFWIGYGNEVMPILFHNTNERLTNEEGNYRSGYVMMRLNNTSPEVIGRITEKVQSFNPTKEVSVKSYGDLVHESLWMVRLFRNIMLLVSAITLFIALMGLIGYINDEVNRRRKEIAIRKVNGADRRDVIMLIARDAAIIAVPAVVVGIAGSYFLGRMLMTLFIQKAPLNWWVFVLGALIILAVVYAIELIRTWRISGSNPVDFLKSE